MEIDEITATIHDTASFGIGDGPCQVSQAEFHATLQAIAELNLTVKRQAGIIDTLREALHQNEDKPARTAAAREARQSTWLCRGKAES